MNEELRAKLGACRVKAPQLPVLMTAFEQQEQKGRHDQIRESLPSLAEEHDEDNGPTGNDMLAAYTFRQLENDTRILSSDLNGVLNLASPDEVEALTCQVDGVARRLRKSAFALRKQPPAVVRKECPFICKLWFLSNPSTMSAEEIGAETVFYLLTEGQARAFLQLTNESEKKAFLNNLKQIGILKCVEKAKTTHARPPKVNAPQVADTLTLVSTDGGGFSYCAQTLEIKLDALADPDSKSAKRRPLGNQPDSCAAALRYYILFERVSSAQSPGAANGMSTRLPYRVLSFPFNISVQTSQFEEAAIASLWFRSFCSADSNGHFFDCPNEVLVSNLLAVCDKFFTKLTSLARHLSPSDLLHIEKKLVLLSLSNLPHHSKKVTWPAFFQNGATSSFASWLYQTAFLIGKYCADFWNSGIIFGFMERNSRFRELRRGGKDESYMLVLSDSKAGVSICYVSGKREKQFEPCDTDELRTGPLLQRITKTPELNGLRLHPKEAEIGLLKMIQDAEGAAYSATANNQQTFYYSWSTLYRSNPSTEQRRSIGYEHAEKLRRFDTPSTNSAASFPQSNSSTFSSEDWRNDGSDGDYDTMSPAQNTHSYDDDHTMIYEDVRNRGAVEFGGPLSAMDGVWQSNSNAFATNNAPSTSGYYTPANGYPIDAVDNVLVTPPPAFVDMQLQSHQGPNNAGASFAFRAASASQSAQFIPSNDKPDV